MNKILDNINVDSNSCWVWQKSCSSSGYGQFTKDKVYWNTHRYVWTKHHGDIPTGDVIRHKCHNRKCCNPEHLELGSHKDNYHDSRDVHLDSDKKRRKLWIVGNIVYMTHRQVRNHTGLSSSTVIKYTDPISRIFNIGSYRAACRKAAWEPKV